MNSNDKSTEAATVKAGSTLTLGATVKRLANDYTGGRIGRIIEIDKLRPRYRVHWTQDSAGKPLNIRTWIVGHCLVLA